MADCGHCVSYCSHNVRFDNNDFFLTYIHTLPLEYLNTSYRLSSFALFSCEFAIKRSTNAGIGLIRSEELMESGDYVCVESMTNPWHWLYRWSMVSGALAPIFGIGVLILMLFDCCCKVSCSKFMQAFLIFCALFNQACTFLIYISTPCYINGLTCKLGYGSVWSMSAFVLYLVAGLFLCFSPKHDPVSCKNDGEAKQAAKQEHDEEQPAPAPAAEKAAETTVVAAAVVKEEKKQPVPVKEEEKEVVEETSVAVAASVKEEEPDDDAVGEVEVDLDEQVKVSVKEDGISARLKESKPDPSVTGNAPDPDALGSSEDPDGDKFVGRSIKASRSLVTAPW